MVIFIFNPNRRYEASPNPIVIRGANNKSNWELAWNDSKYLGVEL